MRIVGGLFRGKKILSPKHEGTRPTSDRARETIFNILLHNPVFGSKVVLHKDVLDVFAGTGALGLEAYSRGAKSVSFIENDSTALSVLEANVKSFDLPHSCILPLDALYLKAAPHPYDLIFLDPPYNNALVLPTLEQLLSKGWISEKAVIVIELSKAEMLTLPPSLIVETERVIGAAKVVFCRYARPYL